MKLFTASRLLFFSSGCFPYTIVFCKSVLLPSTILQLALYNKDVRRSKHASKDLAGFGVTAAFARTGFQNQQKLTVVSVKTDFCPVCYIYCILDIPMAATVVVVQLLPCKNALCKHK